MLFLHFGLEKMEVPLISIKNKGSFTWGDVKRVLTVMSWICLEKRCFVSNWK